MAKKYLDPKADLTFKKVFGEHPDLVISRRTRQTLWGECTDANPKTVAKRYTIEKKLVPLQYES